METASVKIVVDGSQAVQSVGSLKKQLREAQQDVQALSDKFGATSAQAVAAAKKAAELKDRIGDAKALTDGFNPDRKFQSLGTALQGVAGAFSALQGAMALFGSEGKDVEKVLLKVQAAMAVSQGINAIMEFKDSFIILKTVAVNAFRAIKAAITSTGVGAIVVLIGTALAYWDDIKAAVTGINGELRKQNQLTKDILKQEEKKLEKLNKQENALKLQGKSEKEILRLKIAQTNETIKATEENLASQKVMLAAQIEAERRNKAILTGMLRFSLEPLQLLVDGIGSVANALGADIEIPDFAELAAGLVFDPEQIKKEGEAAQEKLQQQLDDLRSQRDGFQLEIRDIDKRANEASVAAQEARLEKEKKLLDDRLAYHKEIEEEIKKLVDDRIKFIEGREKQFAANRERVNKAAEDRIKGIITTSITDRTNITNELLLSQQDKEISTITVQFNKRYELIKGNAFLENKLTEQFENDKANIKLKYENLKLDIVRSSLSNIANVVGKETAAGKAIAIASATIDTYQAANKALKADYGVFGPAAQVARFVAVASTIAAGIKNVKEIAKAKVPGGSSISAPSGLNASPISPSLPIQTTMTQLDQGTINRLGSATNRAYVVETDITNSQERIRRINRAARLN